MMVGPAPIQLGRGHIFHRRNEGLKNAFRYPTFFLHFNCAHETDLHSQLRRHFHRFLSLKSSDYLEGKPGSLLTNARAFIQTHCGFAADEIHLQTLPRMFGYAFNPVNFWLCRRDSQIEAVLVEVNNTFGERHFYWLAPDEGICADNWYRAEKVFHVSPFFPVEGFYKFRFQVTESFSRIDINYHAPDGEPRLATYVQGELQPAIQSRALNLILSYGWMTPMVVARIHYQAIKLWINRTRFYRKPIPPSQEVTG